MSNRTSGHPRLVLRCRGQARALAVRVVFAWSSLLSGFVCVCVFFSPHRTEFSPRPHTPRVMFSIMLGFRVPSKVSLRLWSWSCVPPPSPGSRGGLRRRLCRCDTGLVGPDGTAPVTRLPLRHRLPFLGSAGGICASVFTGGISPVVFLP